MAKNCIYILSQNFLLRNSFVESPNGMVKISSCFRKKIPECLLRYFQDNCPDCDVYLPLKDFLACLV